MQQYSDSYYLVSQRPVAAVSSSQRCFARYGDGSSAGSGGFHSNLFI
jgi:hypothetical protein